MYSLLAYNIHVFLPSYVLWKLLERRQKCRWRGPKPAQPGAAGELPISMRRYCTIHGSLNTHLPPPDDSLFFFLNRVETPIFSIRPTGWRYVFVGVLVASKQVSSPEFWHSNLAMTWYSHGEARQSYYFFDPATGDKSDIFEDCNINLNITPIFLIKVTTSS